MLLLSKLKFIYTHLLEFSLTTENLKIFEFHLHLSETN